MVDLNEYKMDAQIESYGVSPDQSDVAYIAAQVSSIGVSTGFAVTEAGVFATDPDVGEILYAYLDLTEDPQYIYAETDAISKFAEITFNVLIGSVTKVTAYVSPGALTKKVDFNAFKESVETPEFDDSGTVEGISSFPSFLETMKSKMNFFQFFRNLKAGLQFVLHAGQIVNNCVTDNAGLPLSAAQGKALMDKYTQLYSDMQAKNSPYAENTSGASYGLPDYSYVLGNAGNKKGTASGDVYYIAVDAKGGLYGGAQVNNAIDIAWEKTATKNELDKKFANSGTQFNSLSDFPSSGSGFGTNTKALTLYDGFILPEYSRICFMNYGDSPDGALMAIAQNGDLYSAFRNKGTWANGKVR